MRSNFDSQVKLEVPPQADAKGNGSPPAQRPINNNNNKSAMDRIREHRTQQAFLKVLIAHDNSEESQYLQGRLVKVEREETCLCRAVLLMGALLFVSCGGLVYCALLLPEVFDNPTHLLMRSLFVLGLASFVSLLAFLTNLLWHRIVVRRLHKECRRLVLDRVKSQLKEKKA